jgi:hypothetical protein
MPRIVFRSFTGGEVTPTLSARYDLQKFGTFLQCCENFIPNLHGDIERRPGTRYVADLGEESVLYPFQFNVDASENYVLIFQSGKIKVASADRLLDSVSIASPYEMSDVYDLSLAQVGDVVYIAHRKYALRKLTRSGVFPYSWDLDTVTLNKSMAAPAEPVVKWHRGPKNSDSDDEYTKNETSTLRYVVTAVSDDGAESLASPVGSVKARYPSDWVSGDYVDIEWPPVTGAKEYNVYRESAGYYGFIGVAGADTKASLSRLMHIDVNGVTFTKSDSYWIRANYEYYYDGDQEYSRITGYTIGASSNKQYKAYPTWESSETGQRFVLMAPSGASSNYWYLVNSLKTGTIGKDDAVTSSMWGKNTEYPQGVGGGISVVPVFSDVSSVCYFQDQNFEPDTSTTPKEDWDPFVGGNNPATVAFHQQRLVLGGASHSPATFYMSRTGDYENFRKAFPMQDDDPVEYMIASGSIDDIKWLSSFGGLLIGTSGAEYEVSSSGTAITPSSVEISTESYWGSSGLQPLIIGNTILHCQRSGSHVRDLAYSWENDGYSGNDLSILAPQLVEGHSIKQWAYQGSPGSVVWCVRDDGVLLALTYNKEQNVYGWSRQTTQGEVRSVCVISGDNEDVAMFVVKRGDKYFLERLSTRFKDSDTISDAVYLDCSKTVTSSTETVTISGLSHLDGQTVDVLADGAPESGHVVSDGQITLNYPAKVATVGLSYTSVLIPMPIETDGQNGATLGKRRAYGKCILRLYRSIGGAYGATLHGDMFDVNAWKLRTFYDIPFMPDRYDEAVQPFSGDVEIVLPSGQDADTSIIIKQDRPMPFRIVAITADVDMSEL